MVDSTSNSSERNADNDQASVDPRDLSLVERYGSYILFAAAVMAWALALLNVDRDAAASAWIAAGLVLLVGAAFFRRVLKIGKEGVELARFQRAIKDAEQIAPTEDDTPDEATKRVLEYLEMQLYDPTEARTEMLLASKQWQQASARRRHMEWDRVESNLVNSVEAWLKSKGFEITREFNERGSWRYDMRATRNELVIDVEIRSAIESLGRSDAAVLIARASDPAVHRVVVVRQGVSISKEAIDLLETSKVALWAVDPGETARVEILFSGSLPAQL